jgi:hypothetical protein
LRALSLCTCRRHYPGAAIGRRLRSVHPTVSAFPGSRARSACTSAFSRLAQRSLTLRPEHSRRSPIRDPATRRLQTFRHLHACSGCFRLERLAGWGFHPLESAALARRTDKAAPHVLRKRLLRAAVGREVEQLYSTIHNWLDFTSTIFYDTYCHRSIYIRLHMPYVLFKYYTLNTLYSHFLLPS